MTPAEDELTQWVRSVSLLPESPDPLIDVIVPVYGNLSLVLGCLRSVLESRNKTPFELIVIDDASPREPLSPLLQELAERSGLTLLRNGENLGFPATCNRGFLLHPDRDIIILNSDTEVYGDWIDRLRAAAYSDRHIGTVTPLTNDGEIASYPRFGRPNATALELSARDLDELAARVASDGPIEVPTGVGFCMYLKRQCVDEAGVFDAEAFGKGYGEENDLCQRAIEAGWTNVVTSDTFVLHHGGGSFGPSKARRIQAALEVLEKRHPGYLRDVREFIRLDPLRPHRERLDLARVERLCAGPRFLLVTHDWGGGVERHIQESRVLLERDGADVFICRPDPTNAEALLLEGPRADLINNVAQPRLSMHPRHLTDTLARLRIDHVHVHNVAGYGPSFARYLHTALRDGKIPYDVTLHDYQSFCPQNHLVDPSRFYCGEPSEASCQWCIDTLGTPYGPIAIWEWRRDQDALLMGARSVFSPSHDAAGRVSRWFPAIQPIVMSHPVVQRPRRTDARLPRVSTRQPGTVRIGLLGAVSTPKGSRVLRKVAELSDKRAPTLRFIVVGETDIDDILGDQENVEIVGKYRDDSLDALIEAADLDVIWFPAVWPETFSYTLSSALATELHTVAFDIGAVAERLRQHGRGVLLPVEAMLDPEAVLQALMSAVDAPAAIDVYRPLADPSFSILRDYYRLPELRSVRRIPQEVHVQ